MREVALFVVTVYLEAWFASPIPTGTPRRDLALMKSLIHYAGGNPAIPKATSEKFRHQLWHLSEDLLALAFFFDTGVLLSKRMAMAAVLEKEDHEDHVKRPLLYIYARFQQRTLSSFVSMRTKESLKRFGLDDDVLGTNPATWQDKGFFQETARKLSALSVTNDTAERGVALIQEYNKLLTKKVNQFQFLFQVASEHRAAFPDSRKATLTRKRRQ